MIAADAMTRAVSTVLPETTLAAACALMVSARVSGLPVVDAAGRLVGMLTEGDLLHRTETGTGNIRRSAWIEFWLGRGRYADEYVTSHSRVAGDLMTPEVITATEETPLGDIIGLMERKHVRRVPIVRGGALVGIVSRSDLVAALGAVLLAREHPLAGQALAGRVADDNLIVASVRAEIGKQRLAGDGEIGVTSSHGVVRLEGTIFDERCRAALRVAAENVHGVTRVEDELVLREPAPPIYAAM